MGPAAGAGMAKVQFLVGHTPYYWEQLRSLPFGLARRISGRKCRGYAMIEPFMKALRGLEIGGPSPIFGGNRLIPVYGRCGEIDNANFCRQTIWDAPASSRRRSSGQLSSRRSRAAFANQYVAEAGDLAPLASETYDFLLASHVLEHIANPLQALREWKRVLRPKGAMVVIVPDKRATFDHRRPYTTLAHLAADDRAGVAESDLTHLEEILALHDTGLDPRAGTSAQFHERCARNFLVRAMHHHVFGPVGLVGLFSAAGLRILSFSIERPFHQIVLAQKTGEEDAGERELQNLRFLDRQADWRSHDPLHSAGRDGSDDEGER